MPPTSFLNRAVIFTFRPLAVIAHMTGIRCPYRRVGPKHSRLFYGNEIRRPDVLRGLPELHDAAVVRQLQVEQALSNEEGRDPLQVAHE